MSELNGQLDIKRKSQIARFWPFVSLVAFTCSYFATRTEYHCTPRLLKLVPQIHMNSLPVGVRLQARLTQLPPNATLLYTTKRNPEVGIVA